MTAFRVDGTVVTGLLAQDREDAIVLRDPAAGGQTVVLPKDEVEERAVSKVSLMPAGQVNQLADRQKFLDLATYLIEAAESGPARPGPGRSGRIRR